MQTRTIFLSKLLGLACILVAAPLMLHRQASVALANEVAHNPAMLFAAGLMAMVAGLAMVLAHNVWKGGVLPVVVTLCGWVILVRGVVVLFVFPCGFVVWVMGVLQLSHFLYLYGALTVALGVYLTYGGFRAKTQG